jgi:hypothetical protein
MEQSHPPPDEMQELRPQLLRVVVHPSLHAAGKGVVSVTIACRPV